MKLLKKIAGFLTHRVFLVSLTLVAQLTLLVILLLNFSQQSGYVYVFLQILSMLVVIWLIAKDQVPEYKIVWIVFVLALPLFGGVFYLLFGNNRKPRSLLNRLERTHVDFSTVLGASKALPENPYNQLHAHYVEQNAGYPVFANTQTEYYPVGELMFARMIEEMEQAKKYICAEFFIVSDGAMLDQFAEVMERKIAEGVEIFFLYDDFGTMFNLSAQAKQHLRDIGVKTIAFNPFRPHLNTIQNHRDHRKILLIDGLVAFTGGINIADEYINQKLRFGHWKDTGILVKGEAAWAFGPMFFQHWHFAGGEKVEYADYAPPQPYLLEGDGFVQVFGDTPMDTLNCTETVYIRAIQQAKDYIYIATPYLVIDNAMIEALRSAAQSGVDVRISTPHIYDKWYVYYLTISHYSYLMDAGVKIYEYEPGFLHGKMFVSDDRIGVVGTTNMDFRSFYLHFENSALLYEGKVLQDIKTDLVNTQDASIRITAEMVQKLPFWKKTLQTLLKFFAPLL